jgi:hypothetical protein
MSSIRNWPVPQDYDAIRRFLGLVNYVASYMPNMATYTTPLSAIGSKRNWVWTELHQKAFDMIKLLACRSPILAPINP